MFFSCLNMLIDIVELNKTNIPDNAVVNCVFIQVITRNGMI